MATPKYQRVCLKISGEALAGPAGHGVDTKILGTLVREIQGVLAMDVQLSVVVGGGNLIRGITAAKKGFDRATADYMGMLSTVINGMALQQAAERAGLEVRVLTALHIDEVAEPYIRRRAIRHMEKGRLVILAAGTGRPFFSTDTAAALRAAEIGCDVVLKATKVDGVYSADPKIDPQATKFDQLTHTEVLQQGLQVMDATAATLCRENDIPIIVFNLFTPGNLAKVICGEQVGTLVTT